MSKSKLVPSSKLSDLSDVRAFCLVVDLGSITQAAKSLGETKGSVSRRLSRLEGQLGALLVRRSARLVQPTDEGLAFRNKAGQALDLLDRAGEELQNAGDTPRGTLRVTAPQDLATSLLAPILPRFHELYPDIYVELLSTERLLDFDAERIDVALRGSWGLKDSSLKGKKLMDVTFGLYAAPSYLRAAGTPKCQEDLREHRFLFPFGAPGQTILPLQDRHGKPMNVRLTPHLWSNDGAFITEATLHGGGIALLPRPLARPHEARGALEPVLPEYRPQRNAALYVLQSATKFVPPKVRVFREFLDRELSSE